MNIKLVILSVGILCALEASVCQKNYSEDSCNKIFYEIGWDMDVNSYAILYDNDQDGVGDTLDKCPQTPLKDSVDIDGCSIKISFKDIDNKEIVEEILETQDSLTLPIEISFNTRESNVTEEYLEVIQEFADFLNKNPKYSAKIVGHTDSRGAFTNNTELSMNRAKSVVEVLISLGIEESRLTYNGVGPNEPVATNSTESGRAKNRRIEAILTVGDR